MLGSVQDTREHVRNNVRSEHVRNTFVRNTFRTLQARSANNVGVFHVEARSAISSSVFDVEARSAVSSGVVEQIFSDIECVIE